MPVVGGVTPPPSKRKRRKFAEEEPQPTRAELVLHGEPSLPDAGNMDFDAKLANVEAYSAGSLTTDLTYGIAFATVDNREAALAAAAIASQLQLPKTTVRGLRRGKPGAIIDPGTGAPITLQRARALRLANRVKMVATLGAVLEEVGKKGLRVPVGGRVAGETRQVAIRSEQIADAVEALAPLPGKLSFEDALGTAIGLIMQNTDLRPFSINLATIASWNGSSGQFTESQMIGLAQWWTKNKDRIINRADIVAMLSPEAATLGARAQKLAHAEATLPEFPAGSLRRFPLPGAIGGVPIEDLSGAYEAALAGGAKLPVATRIAREAVRQLNDDNAGWLGTVVGKGLELWDRAFQVAAGSFQWVLAGVGDPTGDPTAFQEARDIIMYRKRFGDVWADRLGFDPGTLGHSITSLGSELLVGWFLDPVVMLGQTRRIGALRRVIAPTEAELKGLGIPGLFYQPPDVSQLLTKINGLADMKVTRTMMRAIGLKGESLRFRSWLMYAARSDYDQISNMTRGFAGLGPGVDRRVAGFMHEWALHVKNGVTDSQTADELFDILKVSFGVLEPSQAGKAFQRFLSSNAETSVGRLVDRSVRRALSRKAGFSVRTGQMHSRSARAIRKNLSQQLLDAGISPKLTGRVVERLVSMNRVEWAAAQKVLDTAVEQTTRIITPAARRGAARRLGNVTWGDTLHTLSGRQRIIPSIGPVQIIRDMRVGITESSYWRAKGIGRWFPLHKAFDRAPRPWISIEEFGGDEMLARALRGFGLGEDVISNLRAEFQRIQLLPLGQKEAGFKRLIDNILEGYYRRIGAPPELVDAIMRYVRPRYEYSTRVAQAMYGSALVGATTGTVRRGRLLLEAPPLETMLLNVMMLPDPHAIETGIRRAFGSVDGIKDVARKLYNEGTLSTPDIMNLPAGELAVLTDSVRGGNLLFGAGAFHKAHVLTGRGFDTARYALDELRSLWVATVLFRAGWPLKVLPDENFRALISLHSMRDRLEGIKFAARAGRKLGVFKATEIPLTVRGKAETLRLEIPGLLADEPAASQGLAAHKIFKSVAAQQYRYYRNVRRMLEMVTPEQGKSYWEALEWILNQRIRQSDLGDKILRYLAGDATGGDVWDLTKLRNYAKASREMKIVGRGRDFDEAFDEAVGFVQYYLGGEKYVPDLASDILHSKADLTAIQRHFRGRAPRDMPTLFLRDAEEASMFRTSFASSFRDRFFTAFMRAPSSYLNRNPMFKVLYTQELKRLVNLAKARGHKFTMDEVRSIEAGTHQMALTAKEYALRKELNTMYSFMNRSQFAEASRFIFPFFSPFEEQWTVWGKLLWESPQTLGRARLLWQAAVESGAVRQDDRGEWVIPGPVLAGAILASTFFHPIGWLPAIATGGPPLISKMLGVPNTEWVFPLSSLNLFFATPFNVPIGDTEVPLPTPGFGPGVNEFVQWVVEHYPASWPGKARLMAYAFQYGPNPRILPSSINNFLDAWWHPDENKIKRTVNDMLEVAVTKGIDISAMSDAEKQVFLRDIRTQAEHFLKLTAFVGWAAPTAGQFTLRSDELREEFFDNLDANNGDWDRTAEQFKERYAKDFPDVMLVVTSATMWNRGLKGGAQAPPPTELWARMQDDPRLKQMATLHPEFAYFLIPSEFRDEEFEFSYNVWAEQLDSMMRSYREPAIFEEGELIGGRVYEYQRQEGWNQYFAALETFRALLDRKQDKTKAIIDTDSELYTDLKAKWLDPAVNQIMEEFPPFAKEFSQTQTSDPFTRDNLNKLRAISETPLWEDTGFGKALASYFALRDPIYKWMVRNNVSSITDRSAKVAGRTKAFNEGVRDLKQQFEDDFTRPWSMWLDQDLQFVSVTKPDIQAMTIPESVFNHHIRWEDRWTTATNRAFAGFVTDNQRRAGFAKMRNLSINAAAWSEAKTGDPFDPRYNAQMRWWERLSPQAQREHALSTATKPYVFMSPFERNVILGVETTGQNERLWSRIEHRKLQTYKDVAADPEHSRNHWEEFNKWVDNLVEENPGFNKELARNRQWGWAVWKTISTQYPTWMKGSEGKAWRALQSFTKQVRTIFVGADFVDSDEYAKVRNITGELIKDFMDYSPDFKSHYKLIQDVSGDQLLEILLPEFWWIKV